jgi:hypothetical protein
MVSTLAEQMLCARARAQEAREEGKDARVIESIDRSIRRTLSCLAQLRDPRQAAARGFSLWVTATGDLVVRHREAVLPVSKACLDGLLAEAGVRPHAGQIFLLDGVFVRVLVEEALGSLSLKEAELRSWKSQLLKASLEAEYPDGPVEPRESGASIPAA